MFSSLPSDIKHSVDHPDQNPHALRRLSFPHSTCSCNGHGGLCPALCSPHQQVCSSARWVSYMTWPHERPPFQITKTFCTMIACAPVDWSSAKRFIRNDTLRKNFEPWRGLALYCMILIYRDPEFMIFLDNTCHHSEYSLMSCIGAANRIRRGVCTD